MKLPSAAVPRILSAEECEAVFKRTCAMAHGGGDTAVALLSWWQGEVRWGRNRVSLASDRRDILLQVQRMPQASGGITGSAVTNQLDDASLEAVVRAAERAAQSPFMANGVGAGGGGQPPLPEYKVPAQAIWSDATYNLTPEQCGEVVRKLVEPAEAKGLLSAGYIEARAGALMMRDTSVPELAAQGGTRFWERPYVRWTQTQCSMTVRNQKGTGSGWAGLSSYDWAQIDTAGLAERALQKCVASENPVALEPGRYMVILEPEAVADLVEPLMASFGQRPQAESHMPGQPPHVWYWRTERNRPYSKLGLKVMDDRITINHDPADPRLGVIMGQADTPGPVTWIDRGVLVNLGHDLEYGIEYLQDRNAMRGATGYGISGGTTSVAEMIHTTKRGLLVTRFSNVQVLTRNDYLETGLTRDGMWLIENGVITKAVKNFRFTESPLFVLNSIEQLGEPVIVHRPTRQEGGPLTPAIVPPLKVRDFNFTAMIDGV